MKLSPDDPKLTAYALGELQGQELAEVEAAVLSDPAAQAVVEQTRAFTSQLSNVLAAEPVEQDEPAAAPQLGAGLHRAAIVPGRDPSKLDGGRGFADYVPRRSKILQFPQLYYVIGGLAAAAVAVRVALLDHEPPRAIHRPQVAHVTPSPTPAVAMETAKPDDTEEPVASGPSPAQLALLAARPTVPVITGTPMVSLAGSEYPFVETSDASHSTFGLQIQPESFADMRRSIAAGRLPPLPHIKTEELVNAFDYADPAPASGTAVGAAIEVADAPWEPTHRLVRIGLKTRPADASQVASIAAKDVKVDVAFNPNAVTAFRLIGYENHSAYASNPIEVAAPGADLSAGYSVTALYEVMVKAARSATEKSATSASDLLTLHVRYKQPDGSSAHQLDVSAFDSDRRFADASADFKFAAAVASFGMILRDSQHSPNVSLDDVISWASAGAAPSEDPHGQRSEFIDLARRARSLVH